MIKPPARRSHSDYHKIRGHADKLLSLIDTELAKIESSGASPKVQHKKFCGEISDGDTSFSEGFFVEQCQ